MADEHTLEVQYSISFLHILNNCVCCLLLKSLMLVARFVDSFRVIRYFTCLFSLAHLSTCTVRRWSHATVFHLATLVKSWMGRDSISTVVSVRWYICCVYIRLVVYTFCAGVLVAIRSQVSTLLVICILLFVYVCSLLGCVDSSFH